MRLFGEYCGLILSGPSIEVKYWFILFESPGQALCGPSKTPKDTLNRWSIQHSPPSLCKIYTSYWLACLTFCKTYDVSGLRDCKCYGQAGQEGSIVGKTHICLRTTCACSSKVHYRLRDRSARHGGSILALGVPASLGERRSYSSDLFEESPSSLFNILLVLTWWNPGPLGDTSWHSHRPNWHGLHSRFRDFICTPSASLMLFCKVWKYSFELICKSY